MTAQHTSPTLWQTRGLSIQLVTVAAGSMKQSAEILIIALGFVPG